MGQDFGNLDSSKIIWDAGVIGVLYGMCSIRTSKYESYQTTIVENFNNGYFPTDLMPSGHPCGYPPSCGSWGKSLML